MKSENTTPRQIEPKALPWGKGPRGQVVGRVVFDNSDGREATVPLGRPLILDGETSLEKRLRAEIATLREALAPFAQIADRNRDQPNNWHVPVKLDDCRAAMKALLAK